jgi:hypothetical protein
LRWSSEERGWARSDDVAATNGEKKLVEIERLALAPHDGGEARPALVEIAAVDEDDGPVDELIASACPRDEPLIRFALTLDFFGQPVADSFDFALKTRRLMLGETISHGHPDAGRGDRRQKAEGKCEARSEAQG